MAINKHFRREIILAIGDIQDNHCKNCEDPKRLTEKNNTSSIYCSTKCKQGIKLKRYGDMLEGREPIPVIRENEIVKNKQSITTEEPSKEYYLKLKEDKKLTDRQIRERWGIDNNQLHKLKKEWGVIGMFGPVNNKKDSTKSTPVSGTIEVSYKELEEELKESRNQLEKLQKLRSEDVAVIDSLKAQNEILEKTRVVTDEDWKRKCEEVEQLKVDHEQLKIELELERANNSQHSESNLVEENNKLKVAIKELLEQKVELSNKYSKKKDELYSLKHRVHELSIYKEKYLRTKEALKVHL